MGIRINDPESEGKNGQSCHFQVLYGKWQTDDGDCKKCGEQQVHQRKLKTRQQNPYHIHDDGYRPARRLFLTYFCAKWRQAQNRQLKTLDSERYADDGNAQDDSAKNVSQGYQKPTEYEP